MTILVTAFEPFQGETVNATMEALALLPDAIGGHTLVKRILPVVFGQAIREIGTLVDQLQPGAVMSAAALAEVLCTMQPLRALVRLSKSSTSLPTIVLIM